MVSVTNWNSEIGTRSSERMSEQRALGLGVEGADRFQRIAEEVETHGLVEAGREEIENAAAHGIFAGLAHGRGARIAVVLEPGDDRIHRHDLAGRDRERLRRDRIARRARAGRSH